MTDHLTREDWLRIADALGHFSHNTEYMQTLDKVNAIIGNE